ncbi:MAG: DUF262 domain-containing HNH endonuclease family protein [Planctomycetota bacterium]
MQSFDSKTVTIADVLCGAPGSQVRLPDYQRGFSWEKDEVSTFLRDVLEFDQASGVGAESYFLGSMILQREHPADREVLLVDGQQRMSTIGILLSVLRDAARSLGASHPRAADVSHAIHDTYLSSEGPEGGNRYSLRLGDLDSSFYEAFILRRDRKKEQPAVNESNRLIADARDLCERTVNEWLKRQPDPLAAIERLSSLVVQRIVVVAISVRDDREAMFVFERVNKRGRPLSDADLILHHLMMGSNLRQRGQIRRSWHRMADALPPGTSVTRLLRHLWLAEGRRIQGKRLPEAVSDHIGGAEVNAEEFAAECASAAEVYAGLFSVTTKHHHHVARAIVPACHRDLEVAASIPLLLAAVRRFGKAPEFSTVVLAAEALIVRHRFFAGLDARELDGALHAAASAVFSGASKEFAVQQAVGELQKVDPRRSQMRAGVVRPAKIKKPAALYILRRLESAQSQGAYAATATLEHIFPTSATEAEWGARAQSLVARRNHLGNLTLLAPKENARAGNRSYSKKKPLYASSVLALTRSVVEAKAWSEAAIKRRAESLAELADEVWRVR